MRRTAALIAAVALASCGDDDDAERHPTATATPGRVLVADDRSFERIAVDHDGRVLVLFWAPWSGPDRIVLPYLDVIARERPDLRVVKVDVDKSPRTSQRYEVLAVPTAMILREGEVQGDPVVGTMPRERWERELGID
jgi:thioredoxin 1